MTKEEHSCMDGEIYEKVERDIVTLLNASIREMENKEMANKGYFVPDHIDEQRGMRNALSLIQNLFVSEYKTHADMFTPDQSPDQYELVKFPERSVSGLPILGVFGPVKDGMISVATLDYLGNPTMESVSVAPRPAYSGRLQIRDKLQGGTK